MAEHLLWYMFNERHMMDVIGLNCTVWTAGGSKIFKLKSTGRHIALINLKEKKKDYNSETYGICYFGQTVC